MKIGSKGTNVRDLQLLLNQRGAKITVDGWFGEATAAAVLAAQIRYGLVADGVAGPKTIAALQAGGRPKNLLSLADLERARAALDVPLAAIRAVNEVESRGAGFLADGRPVILYERHVMHRRLVATLGQAEADKLAAKYPALVNPQRGGYRGDTAEHGRLKDAMSIHPACAQEACSWGAYQVMGYHWKALGYDSIADFVARMQRSEGEHLDAFVRFVAADGKLLKALRTGKWAVFAEGYNGPDYAANLYDIKLERAFERYSKLEAVAA